MLANAKILLLYYAFLFWYYYNLGMLFRFVAAHLTFSHYLAQNYGYCP